MSNKTFGDLKNEWSKGYDEAKQEGEAGFYIFATLGVSLATLVAMALVIGLFLLILDAAFWYIIGAVSYVVLARIFGWPTPLDAIKKVFGK